MTIGIIANPASGKDIRRLVAQGSVFDTSEKTNILRRVLRAIDALGDVGRDWEIGDGSSAVGGGSLPGETLPTRVLLAPRRIGAAEAAAALRKQRPAVVGRIERDRLVLDLRTVLPEEDTTLIEVLRTTFGNPGIGDGSCAS